MSVVRSRPAQKTWPFQYTGSCVLCSVWNSVTFKVAKPLNITHLAAEFCRKPYVASVFGKVQQDLHTPVNRTRCTRRLLDVDAVSTLLFVLGTNAFIPSAGRVFCRDTMQKGCSLKFAICLAVVPEHSQFVSVAQCLKTPLGFEPEDCKQATSQTRPSEEKNSAVKIGLLPILELAAEFSTAHMAQLDKVAMPQMPPSTAIPADDPIRIEDQYYLSLVKCAFAGPK